MRPANSHDSQDLQKHSLFGLFFFSACFLDTYGSSSASASAPDDRGESLEQRVAEASVPMHTLAGFDAYYVTVAVSVAAFMLDMTSDFPSAQYRATR